MGHQAKLVDVLVLFAIQVIVTATLAVSAIHEHNRSSQFERQLTAVEACLSNTAYTRELIPQCVADYNDMRKG